MSCSDGVDLLPQHVRRQTAGVELRQEVEVVGHQAHDHQGLEGDEAPEVVHPGEAAPAVLHTEVVQDHHHRHQHRVAHRKDVEGGPADVLGEDVELEVAALPRDVVVVEEELVNEEEGCPVAAGGGRVEGAGGVTGGRVVLVVEFYWW